MADTSIFSVEPPRWLQAIARPIDSRAAGQTLGALTGGLINAAMNNQPVGESINDSFQAIADPLWQYNKSQADLRLKLGKVALETAQMNLDNAHADVDTIPAWLRDHPTLESRLDAVWPLAKTPQAQMQINSLRRADAQQIVQTSRAQTALEVAKIKAATAPKFSSTPGKQTADRQTILKMPPGQERDEMLKNFDRLAGMDESGDPKLITIGGENFVQYGKILLRSNDPKIMAKRAEISQTITSVKSLRRELNKLRGTDESTLTQDQITAKARQQEQLLKDIDSEKKQLDKLVGTTPTATTPPALDNQSPFQEGQIIRNKDTGKYFRVVNGQPVELQPQ